MRLYILYAHMCLYSYMYAYIGIALRRIMHIFWFAFSCFWALPIVFHGDFPCSLSKFSSFFHGPSNFPSSRVIMSKLPGSFLSACHGMSFLCIYLMYFYFFQKWILQNDLFTGPDRISSKWGLRFLWVRC